MGKGHACRQRVRRYGVSSEDDQAKLVLLDHRFKSREGLARKILLNAHTEDSTEEQVEEANNKRRELNAGLAIPEGALEFTWEQW